MGKLNISHAIADISYKDSMESLYQLKILVGDEYEDEISKQSRVFKDSGISALSNIFYVRSINELRSFMKVTDLYDFIIRSYVVYSYDKNPSQPAYISAIGGNKITSLQVEDFLVNSILNNEDKGLLSNLIEQISGYSNSYDVSTDTFVLSDCIHTHSRNQRIDDDTIIRSIFVEEETINLSNKEIITMMRDKNKIPNKMRLREEFIALEPMQIISFASQLIESNEVVVG